MEYIWILSRYTGDDDKKKKAGGGWGANKLPSVLFPICDLHSCLFENSCP